MARILRWLVVLVAVAILVWVVDRVAARGRFTAPYSIHGGGPQGTRALAALLRDEGLLVRPLTREIAHLSGGTLIAISGCQERPLRDLTRLERERLARFVDAGGLLVVAGAYEFIPDALGIRVAQRAQCAEPGAEGPVRDLRRQVRVHAAGAPLAHLAPFNVHDPSTLDALPFADATLFLDSELGPVGYTALLGRGRVVVLGIPDAFTNTQLIYGGGALMVRVMRAFAPSGPIWFDEYHLGLGERRSLTRYLRDRGLAPSLVQLLLVIAAWVAVGRLRLLPARDLPAPGGKPSSLQRALGRLYARTGDARGASERIVRFFQARVTRSSPAVDTRAYLHEQPTAHWLRLTNRALDAARADDTEDRS